MFSNFHFNVDETLNVNAGGVTREQIDQAMTRKGSFVGLVFFLPDGVDQAELDCGGLSYCSAGGTGADANTVNVDNPFPACCDDDGDGLGTIKRGPSGDFQLHTYAPSEKIGSGDTFVESYTDAGGSPQQLTGSLNYMFNTTPAIKDYQDGSGAGATVSYPAASDAPGTINNPLPLKADDKGDYVLKIEFGARSAMRSPRRGEPAGFVDLGNLNYQIEVPNGPSKPSAPGSGTGPSPGVGPCSGDSVGTDDTSLTQQSNGTAWRDSAPDRPADPANTLRLKINFTRCLAAKQQALTPGSTLTWELQALSTVNDVSAQGWFVCVPAAGRTDCRTSRGRRPTAIRRPTATRRRRGAIRRLG